MKPRLLYCLHVFCEHCLETKLMDGGGDAGSPNTTIVCPTCEFETIVSSFSSISNLFLCASAIQ